jgi:hypothetical protein
VDLYRASAFADRVNYAASCIVKGHTQGRHFDTCFEMGDGEYVTAALVRRVLSNRDSRLSAVLFQVIDERVAMRSYEATNHLSRKQLRLTAIDVAVTIAERIGYQNL